MWKADCRFAMARLQEESYLPGKICQCLLCVRDYACVSVATDSVRTRGVCT